MSKNAMIIYEMPISLFSFKLRLALRLKNTTIETREPPGGSYRTDAYRAINPAGTIPALVDGQGLLAETDAIIEYLDDIGLGRPLRPTDPRLAARHRMLSRWCDFSLEPAVRRLFPLVGPGRDAAALAEADAAVARGLTLIHTALDARAIHALSDAPGLADCGLAAVMAWLTPLRRSLPLQAAPSGKLEQVVAAIAAHPATSAEWTSYAVRVDAWLASKR